MFERVIQEVCDASQVDFEESGVDQQTLLDLRKVRDKKPPFKRTQGGGRLGRGRRAIPAIKRG